MERKEAIEIFEDELYFSMKPACQKVGEKFTIPTKVYREALCMAIESLKADDSSLEDIPTITIPVEDYVKLVKAIPRECIEQMIAEIENLEQPYDCDTYSAGKMDTLTIIHKYTKEQNNERNMR